MIRPAVLSVPLGVQERFFELLDAAENTKSRADTFRLWKFIETVVPGFDPDLEWEIDATCILDPLIRETPRKDQS